MQAGRLSCRRTAGSRQRDIWWRALVALIPVVASAYAGASGEVTVRLDPGRPGAAVSPLLLGTQCEFSSGGNLAALRQGDGWGALQELAPAVLRFPGGTPAYHYLWHAPKSSYAPAYVSEGERLTTESFLALCSDVGAEPLMQINTMIREGVQRGNIIPTHDYLNPRSEQEIEASAQAMAVAWIRAIKQSTAALPRLWQIGNEDWTYYRADEYARATSTYSSAIRAEHPSARIIAVGLPGPKAGPFSLEWLSEDQRPPWWGERMGIQNTLQDWNGALARLPLGTYDLLSLHLYPAGKGEDTIQRYLSLTGGLRARLGEPIDTVCRLLDEAGKADVNLAITEYATDFSTSVPGSGGAAGMEGFYYTQANGVATADAIGRLVQRSPRVQIGVLHSLFTMGTNWLWRENRLVKGKRPLQHPVWKAFSLWRGHLLQRLCPVTIEGSDSLDTPDGRVPCIGAWASISADACALVLVHRDPSRECEVTIGQAPGAVALSEPTASLLSGSGPGATNWAYDETGGYVVDTRPLKLTPTGAGQWRATLPPLAVLGVRWGRG